MLTAGLYGPLSAALGWAFEHVSYAAAFRDLHYFAAITAVGVALALGAGLQRLPPAFAFGVLALVAVSAAPALSGSELRALIVPPVYVADALDDMRTAAVNGPGRVLWLPAEEPLGLTGAANDGRDFTAYGPSSNPSVSDDYQNPQLAYALATLRSGAPDWNAFAQLNVRYLVFRRYVRSRGRMSFGISVPMAFEGLGDERLERVAARSHVLRLLRRTALSSVYELPRNDGFTYAARAGEGAMRYSELRPFDGRDRAGAGRSAIAGLTREPRSAARMGCGQTRMALRGVASRQHLSVRVDDVARAVGSCARPACVLAGALPRGALLRREAATIGGAWTVETIRARRLGSDGRVRAARRRRLGDRRPRVRFRHASRSRARPSSSLQATTRDGARSTERAGSRRDSPTDG